MSERVESLARDETVPGLGWFIASPSLWQFGFNPKLLHVGFVVDIVVLGQVFSQVLSVSM
jgi:hypothetical protein